MSDFDEMRVRYEQPVDDKNYVELRPGMTDPSGGAIHGRIVGQFKHILSLSDLSEEQKLRCSAALEIICAKLCTIWELRDSYAALEAKLIENARLNPAKRGESVEIVGFQNLYRDFDLFTVQVKSVLDHMVFFLRYGIGLRALGFHKKGKAIINQLEGNLAKNCSPIVKSTAFNIAELIRENESWLKATIDTRDDFNHYTDRKYHPNRFVVFAVTDVNGQVRVIQPVIDDKPVRDVMDLMVTNILIFVECFLGLCLCPTVTKLGISYDWKNSLLDTQFKFGPWEAFDEELAAGMDPRLMMNDRVGVLVPGFAARQKSGGKNGAET